MTDREYFRARARQEDERAAKAHCVEGERIHHELADRYRMLADDRPALRLVAA